MPPIFHMIAGAPDPVAPFSHAVESDGWDGSPPEKQRSQASHLPDASPSLRARAPSRAVHHVPITDPATRRANEPGGRQVGAAVASRRCCSLRPRGPR